jgi:hypothetical protein
MVAITDRHCLGRSDKRFHYCRPPSLGDSQQEKTHLRELLEDRLSKLYQPLMLATCNGKCSLVGDITFYKVYDIMEKHGYIAAPELMEKYLSFLSLCEFAGYEDLQRGSLVQGPPPPDVLLEIIRGKLFPLKYGSVLFKKMNAADKEFQAELKKCYEDAYEGFARRLE